MRNTAAAIAPDQRVHQSGTNQFHGTVFEFARKLRARRQELLRSRRSPDPSVPAAIRWRDDRRTGHPAESDRRTPIGCSSCSTGGTARDQVAATSTPSVPLSAWREGDFSNLQRRERQPHPHLRSRDGVFDAAGNVIQAPTPFPAIAFRRTAFIRCRGSSPTTIRCRCRSGRQRTT